MAQTETMKMAGAILSPLLTLAAILAVAAAAFSPSGLDWRADGSPAVESVRVPGGTVTYREPGAFTLDGHEIDAPLTQGTVHGTLEVMKYQVTAAQYALCAADGHCPPADGPATRSDDLPVTGVSYLDAQAYAAWFSEMTGQRWRLPTDLEWARFANLAPDGQAETGAPQAMADRWLDSYRRMAASGRAPDLEVKPKGHFGENALGIADIGGNVWEWTQTCFSRINLNASGNVMSRLETCGVRVLQGQHRAYMSAFVRDAISGGCAVGTPPDHLGFRLVREVRWEEGLSQFPG